MTQAAKTVRAPSAASPEPAGAAPPARTPYLLALAAGVAVFLFYALTLGPTTWFWDTSEYIATAHIMGIPHPPGNPLFVLLARAWELLLAPFGLSPAVRINLFSAFMSAGTSFFWFLTVHRILGWFTEDERVRRVGAAVSVVIAASAFTVWNQATVNEKVYTVSMFTIAALTWLAFRWRDHIEQHRGLRGAGAVRLHDDNVLVLMVFILALSVANHLMAFLAAPALLLFILLVKPQAFLNWRLYALSAVFGFLGLSVHLFLSIRSGLHPIINEAQPSCPSVSSALISIMGFGRIELPGACHDLFQSLAREQYQKPPVSERQAPFLYQLLNYFQYFDWQWARSVSGETGYFGAGRQFVTLLFVGLGGYGAWEHFRRDRKSFLYVAALFGTLSFGLVYYMNFKYGYAQLRTLEHLQSLPPDMAEVRERDYFFLVSFSLWGLWAGIGLTATWTSLSEALGRGRRSLAMASPILALALVPVALNWSYASRAGDYSARDLAYNILQSVEPYGVLFTNGDNDTFPLWYLQEVEGIRRDVTVIVLSYLNTNWYPKQLNALTAPCPAGVDPLDDPTRIICQRPFEADKAPRFYDASKKPTKSIFPFSDTEIDAIALRGGEVFQENRVFDSRGIQAMIRAGQALYPSDIFVLSIINHVGADRPVYFAATTNAQYELSLWPHTVRQGLAFKVVSPAEAQAAGLQAAPQEGDWPIYVGGYVDPQRTSTLLNDVFMFRNMPDRAVWPDDATRNIPMHYAYAFQAQALMERARNNAAQAQRYEQRAAAFRNLAGR